MNLYSRSTAAVSSRRSDQPFLTARLADDSQTNVAVRQVFHSIVSPACFIRNCLI